MNNFSKYVDQILDAVETEIGTDAKPYTNLISKAKMMMVGQINMMDDEQYEKTMKCICKNTKTPVKILMNCIKKSMLNILDDIGGAKNMAEISGNISNHFNNCFMKHTSELPVIGMGYMSCLSIPNNDQKTEL